MNSIFSEQILADKLSKLNSTQQCIETLSHWCIFHRSKAENVVATWDKQFNSSEMVKKVPLLYLANDILQNSKRKGDEFVTEFWKVLPSALKEVVNKGDDRGKTAVLRLVGIWEERRIFGSHSKSLKDIMLGEEGPPPLELRKKRSHSIRMIKKDSRSIRTKLSVGGTAEKIISAFHTVISEHSSEDEEMTKCKSIVHRVKKMEKDVSVALTKAKDPSRKTLSKELEEDENHLKKCIDKLKVVETNRVALVSQLRDALHEQESELENLRTQMQVAQAQVEEASSMRKRLDEDRVFDPKPLTSSTDAARKPAQNSAAAIAAMVADKLAASTSSQYIMTSVLSTFAAQEAKNAGLTKSSPSTPSLSSSTGQDPNLYMQNNPYPGPGPFSTQAHYHSVENPPPMQYMQQPGPYDYNSLPPLPPGPPPPGPPYMMGPMVSLMGQQQQLNMGQQPLALPQQQSGPFAQQPPAPMPASYHPLPPNQPPGMVYYTHPYQSQ